MAMGKKRWRQQPMWIANQELPRTRGHVFYDRVNEILKGEKFDEFAEKECVAFYKSETRGRPSIAPGVYFRMVMIGYFEGIDSERGIAWRCADSLSLKSFLGCALTETTPDHSTISRTRRLIDVETHGRIFTWMLEVLARRGLINGKTVGIDGTTLEANAAMRSIVRRDTGESYTDFLTKLAQASGIETPTREDLAKLDRNRAKKGCNEEWEHPDDPDAKITKMKDGQTHLAHKAEHAVDMETGAVLAVTLQDANAGDTTTIQQTLIAVAEQMEKLTENDETTGQIAEHWLVELVTDKGYHSNETMVDLKEFKIRSYIAEPKRGRRNWTGRTPERDAVYANRWRIRGERGKGLLRRRGLMLERPFAHCYETGRLRRVHLRGRENILKRLLIHIAGFNLSLVLRLMTGKGTPRGLQDLAVAYIFTLIALLKQVWQELEGGDLLKNPLDEELKTMAQEFGIILKEVIRSVDRFGLKKRHLQRHKRTVNNFLSSVRSRQFVSSMANSYKQRFQKSGTKMFTFLDYDGVPWNNNYAEHAIKRFAKYRTLFDGLFTEDSLNEYLVLASILNTCEFNNINAFRFLLSGERSLNGLLALAKTKSRIPKRSKIANIELPEAQKLAQVESPTPTSRNEPIIHMSCTELNWKERCRINLKARQEVQLTDFDADADREWCHSQAVRHGAKCNIRKRHRRAIFTFTHPA